MRKEEEFLLERLKPPRVGLVESLGAAAFELVLVNAPNIGLLIEELRVFF